MARRPTHVDLISRLPDELLIHILSFVPTTTSVTTSVLSKRWSRLWISVPNIDFSGFVTKSSVRQAQFENFVGRFLSLNNVTPVRTIQLDVVEETDVSRVNAWIAAIGDHNANVVGVCFPSLFLDNFDGLGFPVNDNVDELGFPIYSIPDKFYTQNNLVKLELRDVILKVPRLVCFPNLKKMKLISIQFFDDNSLKNLLFGSPVLQNLRMQLHEGNAWRTLYICSSSLRNLRLETDAFDKDDDYKIVIDTPNLRDLWLSDQVCLTSYYIINLSSLVSASLDISAEVEAFLEILRQVFRVKELVLDGYSSVNFDYTTLVSMPIFNDLIHLEVNCNWPQDSATLFNLFKCTPNFVTFTINGPYLNCAWFEPHNVPQCFLLSIESVEIKWVGDSDQEMRIISYILKNAMVLKKLSLHCSPDRVADNKFLLTLLTLPRSSAIATCQVDYTD